MSVEKSNWVEVKQEAEYDVSNNLIHKKITSECKKQGYSKKDMIDMLFRVIGLCAIGIPIMLVFLQQKAALKNQKSLQQFDTYSQAYMLLNVIKSKSVYDSSFQKSVTRFNDEVVHKIYFIYGNELGDSAQQVSNILMFYKKTVVIVDSINKVFKSGCNEGNALSSLQWTEEVPAFDKKSIQQANSTFLELRDSLLPDIKKTINQANSDSLILNPVKQIWRSCDTMIITVVKYFYACQNIIEMLNNKPLVYCTTAKGVKGKFCYKSNAVNLFLTLDKQKQKFEDLGPLIKRVDSLCMDIKMNILNAKINALSSKMRKTNSWLD